MATIIKATTNLHHASASDVRAAAFDLVDMSSKADEYLRGVRGEAAKIVQQAHRHAEEIRRTAEQEGRRAANEAAHRVLDEKVAQRMATIIPALNNAIRQLIDQRALWHKQCEKTLVRLAVMIAERLVRREVVNCPEIPEAWIRESLELAAGAASVSLRLHPQDLEGLGKSVDRLAEEIGRLAPLKAIADEAVDRGGCIVHTEFGTIDVQVPAQLARMEEELVD